MKKQIILAFLLSTVIGVSSCSAQQYIQKLHEQQKQSSISKQQAKTYNSSFNSNVVKLVNNNNVNNNVVSGDYDRYYQEALEQIESNNLYGAHTSLCKALEIKHDFLKAIKTRGIIRSRLANYNGAILDLSNAISLSANDAELYYERGFAKLALQNFPEAVKDFDKAISLNSNYTKAYHQRGYAYCLWGKSTNTDYYFAKAINDFNNVLNQNPNITEARLYRGMALCERGEKDLGMKDVEQAIEEYKNNNDTDAYQRSIEIYNWLERDY